LDEEGEKAMSETTSVEKEIQATALALVEKASMARVTSQDDLDVANDYVTRFSGIAKRWKEFWAEPIEKAKASYDGLRERRDSILKPLEEAKEKLRRLISDYLTEQRRLKDEAEAKAFAEEQARIRKAAEAKENLELAEMAEEQGDKATAEEFLEKAAAVEKEASVGPAVFVPTRPEMTTAHERVVYDFVVDNVALLPREYMMANEKAIRAHVEAWKDTKPIPGVTITKRIIPVQRRGL
jgi:hypothetical protein